MTKKKVIRVIKKLGRWNEIGLTIDGEAGDGDQLCLMVEQLRPDIVITDMKMPGINGSKLLRKLSDEYRNIKIIIVSGFDDFEYMKQAINSKVVDYILKPIDADSLNAALSNAVREIEAERLRAAEEASRKARNETEFKEEKDGIIRIRKFIDDNYMTKISLSELSRKFYWSEEYICKMFKKKFECNLFEYIVSLKIEKAKHMLLNDVKVSEIVSMLGFTDISHFSKFFKKHTGLTPRDFRNSGGKTDIK